MYDYFYVIFIKKVVMKREEKEKEEFQLVEIKAKELQNRERYS